MIFMFYIFQLFRKEQRVIDLRIDELSLTASDFAVACNEIPVDSGEDHETLKSKIKHSFENQALPAEDIKVSEVILCYNLEDFCKKQDLHETEVDKLNNLEKLFVFKRISERERDFREKIYLENIHKLEKELAEMRAKFVRGEDVEFTGSAFVIFDKPEMATKVLEQWQLTLVQ